MEAASRPVLNGLGGKVGVQPVAGGNRFDHGLEGDGIIRGGEGVGIAEVDLILPGAFLVVGGFRLNAHLFQCQTDFPADVFTLILRRNVHIACLIVGNGGGLIVFVQFEQVKFHFGAKIKPVSGGSRIGDGLLQQGAGVTFKGRAVRIGDSAVHPNHPSVFRPPGKHRQRGGIGMEQKVGMHHIAEAGNGGGIDGNPVFKRALQFGGHDGNVLRPAVNVTESETDEFHILLQNVLDDLLR